MRISREVAATPPSPEVTAAPPPRGAQAGHRLVGFSHGGEGAADTFRRRGRRRYSGRRLLLFDVDQTLITSGGAGEQSLKRVAAGTFGAEEDLNGIEIAGRTDSGIVRQILAKHNLEATSQSVEAFLGAYVAFLALELPLRAGRVMPGIAQLLEKLKQRPQNVLALLTGNVARGAQLKLEFYGLWKYFAFGAYADDHYDRNELGPIALARALEKTGHQFIPGEIDVIGDTGHDIACGKAIGARTIAVATGSWSREELAQQQPDFLFDDLAAVDEVIATLGW